MPKKSAFDGWAKATSGVNIENKWLTPKEELFEAEAYIKKQQIEIDRLELLVKQVEQDRERATSVIAELFFAYLNKEEDFPHVFEVKALEEGLYFLQEHYEGNKYNLRVFENEINRIYEILDN